MSGGITTGERVVDRNMIDNIVESDMGKAEARANLERITASGTYTREDFNKDMLDILKRAKADNVIKHSLLPALNKGAGGAFNGDPTTVNVSEFEKRLIGTPTHGAYLDIQDQVVAKGRGILAQKHIEHLVNGTGLKTDEYLQNLQTNTATTGAYSPEVADLILKGVQPYIDNKVASYKAQLDAGTMSETDLQNMANATINPQYKASLLKLYNDPERVKARKDIADKAQINSAAANYNIELGGVATGAEGPNLSQLSQTIKNLPGYATFPLPVRKAMDSMLLLQEQKGQNNRDLNALAGEEQETKFKIEKAKYNIEQFKKISKQLAWILTGLAIGGASGFLIPSLIGAGTFSITGGILAASAAGGVGYALSKNEANAAHLNVIAAKKKMIESEQALRVINNSNGVKGIDALATYTKIAALVTAQGDNQNPDAVLKAFLANTGLTQMTEILKV